MNKTRNLQSNMLQILQETLNVIEENNINYQINAGSLLGTIRHKGFIPWDDDMDIVVKRKDYEKLIQTLEKSLDRKEYFIQNYKSDPYFPHTFTRVCLIDSVAKQNSWKYNNKMKHHVFIDIFPLDEIDNIEDDLKSKSKKIDLIISLKGIKAKHFLIDTEYKTLNQKFKLILKKCLYFLLYPIRISRLNQMHEKIQTNSTKPTGLYVNLYEGNYQNRIKTVMTDEDLNNTIKLPFENIEVKVPKNYDEILKKLYGDYLKYPKEEDQRGNHNFIELELVEKYSNLLD